MLRLALPLLLAVPLLAAEPYRPGPGRHMEIGTAKLALKDAARGKDLPVRVTYPARAKGPRPVLVFSHGMYGSRDGYQPLARFWAGHGYVCVQATHEDSLSLGRKTRAQAAAAWRSRPGDVTFLIDSLEEIGKRIKVKLDAARIGVGGHSFGAHTSQLIGGATVFALRGPLSFLDKRVRCVLLLSPQGKGGLLREASWKTLAKPALVLSGSKDTSDFSKKPPEWRLDPYKYSPKGDKYLVWIEDAHHGFGGISGVRWPGAGPQNEDQVKVVQYAGLAFLDAYVRGDEKAKTWLRSGALAKATKAQVRVESK